MTHPATSRELRVISRWRSGEPSGLPTKNPTDMTVAWIYGLRLSVQGRWGKYWIRYGGIDSNTTRNKRHALRWACRMKSRLAEKPIQVLGFEFDGDKRYHMMTYNNL